MVASLFSDLDSDIGFINAQRDQRLEKAVVDGAGVVVPQAALLAWPDDEAVFGTARLNRQAILRERDAWLEREAQLQKAADPYHMGAGQSGGGQFTSAAEAGGASPIPQPPKPPQPGAHAAVAPVKAAPVTKPVQSHGGMKPATPLGGGGRGPQPPVTAKPKSKKTSAPPKATPKTPPKSTGSGRKPAKQELSEVRAEIISADAKLAGLRRQKARLVAAGSASTSSGGPAKSGTSMGAGAGAGAAAGAAAGAKPGATGSTASSTSSSTASATTKTPSAQYAQQIHQLDQEINDTIVQIRQLKAREQQLLH